MHQQVSRLYVCGANIGVGLRLRIRILYYISHVFQRSSHSLPHYVTIMSGRVRSRPVRVTIREFPLPQLFTLPLTQECLQMVAMGDSYMYTHVQMHDQLSWANNIKHVQKQQRIVTTDQSCPNMPNYAQTSTWKMLTFSLQLYSIQIEALFNKESNGYFDKLIN